MWGTDTYTTSIQRDFHHHGMMQPHLLWDAVAVRCTQAVFQ
jgi:hypothetical protein